MQRVTHHGRETAYEVTEANQDGPRILYVHGSGGNHQSWVYQYGAGGPSHPAIALDLSGHGESSDIDTPPGQETLTAYVEDVAAVAADTDPSIIVGHSMGGAVVLEALLTDAVAPAQVVLAGTGASLPVNEQIQTLLSDDFEALVEYAHNGPFLYHDVPAEVLEQSKATLLETGQAVSRRDFLTCNEFDIREALDSIETPALAIVGTEDRLTPPSYSEQLASEMPHCELETIDAAGHMLMIEQAAAFNRAVGSFIDQNDS